jgi:acetylglutamate kinase
MVSTVITETKVSTVKKVTDKVDLTNQAAATEKALAAFTFAKERFKLAHSTNSKIDRKVLQELFPEAFEATLVKTPYTFIKTI